MTGRAAQGAYRQLLYVPESLRGMILRHFSLFISDVTDLGNGLTAWSSCSCRAVRRTANSRLCSLVACFRAMVHPSASAYENDCARPCTQGGTC